MNMEGHSSFDAIADAYDDRFTHTEIGRMQRERVYFYLSKILEGLGVNKILEIGCGTGEDAIWLAQRNYSVKATDISEKMILKAQGKAERAGLHTELIFQALSMTDIGSLPEDEKYDLIFTNFGSLNCLSPTQLQALSGPLSDHLQPGGQFVAVVMNKFCLWETIYYLSKFSFCKAFRRWSPEGMFAPINNDTAVKNWYFGPVQFYKLLEPCFLMMDRHPIGFLIPPSYFSGLGSGLLRFLNRLEKLVQHLPLASSVSDHFIIHLKKSG